jgi:hypothetical protein
MITSLAFFGSMTMGVAAGAFPERQQIYIDVLVLPAPIVNTSRGQVAVSYRQS